MALMTLECESCYEQFLGGRGPGQLINYHRHPSGEPVDPDRDTGKTIQQEAIDAGWDVTIPEEGLRFAAIYCPRCK